MKLGLTAPLAGALSPSTAQASPKSELKQLPANPYAPDTLPYFGARTALVLGGGLAGMSAALELAERGYAVTLREKGSVLGGRLATPRLHTSQGEFNVEHGLHMWFDNYHNFKDIRNRLGINHHFRDYEEVFTMYRDYKPEILKSEPPIYPLNLANLLMKSPNMNLFSAFKQLKMMPPILGYNHEKVWGQFDDITFDEWAGKNVSKAFYDLYLAPAASVTLNDPKKISAAEMIHFMHMYFMGQPKAMCREITIQDHATAVLNPWRDRLLDLGVDIQLDRAVPGLRFAEGRALGEINSTEVFDHVVCSLDIPGLKFVLGNSVSLDETSAFAVKDLQSQAVALDVAPPYKVIRLWFDKQADPSRYDILETPQHKPINVVAQFHLMEEESHLWAKKTGGSIMELHLYSNWELAGLSDEQIFPAVRNTFLEILPEMWDANVLDYTVGSYHNFTSFECGQAAIRPMADTAKKMGISNMGLAGDWVHTAYPSALMERAVSTGREAANLVLYSDKIKAAPVTMTSNYGPGII